MSVPTGRLRLDTLPEMEYMRKSGIEVPDRRSSDLNYTGAEVDAMRRVGPFAVVPGTDEVEFELTAGFRTQKHSSVKVKFQQLLESVTGSGTEGLRAKLTRYNPKGVLPISLQVLGATVGRDPHLANHFTFRVTDSLGKPIHSVRCYKNDGQRGAAVSTLGFPLHLLSNEPSASALTEAPALLEDHRHYWHIDLKDLHARTSPLIEPRTRQEFKLVPRDSPSAALCHYALSVKNNIVQDFINNSNFISLDHDNVLKLPIGLFNDVYDAYATKLAEVQRTSYDISHIVAHLEALPLSSDLMTEDLPAYVTFRLRVHMPVSDTIMADNGTLVVARAPELNAGEDDDDDEDDELVATPDYAVVSKRPYI